MGLSRDVYESSAILNSLIPLHSMRGLLERYNFAGNDNMHLSVNIKSPISLPDLFFQIWTFPADSHESPQYRISRKSVQWTMGTDGRTGIMKLIGSVRIFAKAHKNRCLYLDSNPDTTFVQRLAQSQFRRSLRDSVVNK